MPLKMTAKILITVDWVQFGSYLVDACMKKRRSQCWIIMHYYEGSCAPEVNGIKVMLRQVAADL
jgi:hypothetical protein